MRAPIAALIVLLLGVTGDSVYADDSRSAVFAGGWSWCLESDFNKVPGVLKTVSGYTGGSLENPTHEQVTMGCTGHREAAEITYDRTDEHGQFCDSGHSYSATIYTAADEERASAKVSRKSAEDYLEMSVAASIEPAAPFQPAKLFHPTTRR